MKYLISLCFCLSSFVLSAQNLSVTPSQLTIIDSIGSVGFLDLNFSYSGDDSLEIAIGFDPICYHANDETAIYMLFEQTSFFPATGAITWGEIRPPLFIVTPGDTTTAVLRLYLGNTEVIYSSNWNLVFFDRNNVSNQTSINVDIVSTGSDALDCMGQSTNVLDPLLETGKAFPNPTSNLISIPYLFKVSEAKMNIYNTLGELVKTVKLMDNNQAITLDVSTLSNGIYFYQITDGNKLSKIRSFTKYVQ